VQLNTAAAFDANIIPCSNIDNLVMENRTIKSLEYMSRLLKAAKRITSIVTTTHHNGKRFD